MPGFATAEKKRRQVAAGVVVAALVLLVTEITVTSVRQFWIEHPLMTAIFGFGLTLGLTVYLVDEILRRRASRDWEEVGCIALSKLSGEALIVCSTLVHVAGFDGQAERMLAAVESVDAGGPRPGAGLPSLLPEGFEQAVEEILNDPEVASEFALLLGRLGERLDIAIATWAPVMLQNEDLAKALNCFAQMRHMLAYTANCVDDAHEKPLATFHFWVNLRVFLLLFAGFDNLRRQARNEPRLFGETAPEWDRAWGMPFAAVSRRRAGAAHSN